MTMQPVPLKGAFGALLEGVSPRDLADPAFRREAYALWLHHRGLLVLRKSDGRLLKFPLNVEYLAKVHRADLDLARGAPREQAMIEGYPILRIGNVRDAAGTLRAQFAKVPALRSEAHVRYDPATRRPV